MVGARGERTNRTAYIIYFLAALQAAAGTYLSARSDDQKALQELTTRVAAIENTMPLRRQMRDQQMQDLTTRIQHLEERLR